MHKVIGFDGREHKFNFPKNRYRKFTDDKSSLHLQARDLIKETWPNRSIYEEVTLPGSKKPGRKSLLYADFFLPELMLVIEVHGKQHYEYCPFFHKDRLHFVACCQRDRDKIEWCRMNDIDIIILPYNERNTWKTLIESK